MDGVSIFENPRNARISAFDRPSSLRAPLKSDYDVGKTAWNDSSNIWRRGSGLLDGTTEDEPNRPSPVRQNSSSNSFNTSRKSQNTTLSPIDNMKTASRSGVHWIPPTTNGATTRPAHIVSPSKSKLNGFHFDNDLRSAIGDKRDFVFDNPPDFGGSDENLLPPGMNLFPSQRLPPDQTTHDRTPINFDDQSRMHHIDSNRFTSNGGISSHMPPRGPTEKYAYQSASGPGQSYFNGRQPSTAATISSQDTSLSPTSWAGASPYENRFNQMSPTSLLISKPTISNENYFNGYQNKANSSLDETVNSIAGLNLSGDDIIQQFQELTNQIPRRQYNPPQALSRPGTLSQARYPQDEPYLHSSKPSLRLTGNSGQQVQSPYANDFTYVEQSAQSPMSGGYRSSLHSPYYSTTGTPPTGPDSIRSAAGSGISSRTSHHDAVILDRKLRNLEPFQSTGTYFAQNFQQMPYAGTYDLSMHPSAIRMNPLAVPYSMPTYSNGNYSSTSRIPARESDIAQTVRSPLLEEFRMNNKTNKRYELRDIYSHIVEFSGDQHGSRFIQQKLETANSDEKDQVFKEIQPNALQLMTDVFGNYVIQKMFEHGNQSQKKVLANYMKGHVLNLSLQMYGCRVVQKAIEHVLTDQQASLVKELDGANKQVLKVIRDQNGNHVVQKAIERVPAEYIQFIVEAHRGEVVKLATHTYGCRVIQRILEHCEPPAKRIILDELHGCVPPLITDSFGNYVVQHVIQNGEPDDRRRVVTIVLQQLIVFSKHKFASNVVEKCIEYADADQRGSILQRLICADEAGQTPVLGLLRDQYGNYVIQKIYSSLKDDEGREALAAEMKVALPHLKRTSYGKQVIAIEKLLYGSTTPPSLPSSSSRGSEPASTNASSTIEGGVTPPSLQMTKHFIPAGQTPLSFGSVLHH